MTDEFSKTFVNEATAQGRIPSLHIIGDSIPIAWYRAMKAVWEEGIEVRTEYDRVNEAGDFIDPSSRDARVLIEVKDPFAQPRFPPLSFCEIGTYIAEIMGVKDHLVLPMQTLRESIGGKLSATPVAIQLSPASFCPSRCQWRHCGSNRTGSPAGG